MTAKEKTIVAAIRRELELRGCYVVKLHGGAYQPAGLPDLLVVHDGSACFMEVKKPGSKPSWRQEVEIRKIRNAGVVAAVVTSTEEALYVLGLALKKEKT